MTGNPLVHMGPFSLAALLLSGMAWGQMPVDPTRMRGKYAEAKVAFAGPAINLSLAILTLTALGFWHRSELQTIRSELPPLVERMVEQPDNPSNEGAIDRFFDERFGDRSTQENAQLLLWIFGVTNFVLFLFNLLPVPPLDGSAILANLHRGYATWLHEKVSPGLQMLLFAAAFCFSGYLFRVAGNVASRYIGWVMTF
jgi:Zn-dependent protease